MKVGPLVPLGVLLTLQHFAFGLLVSTYPNLYFPGVRVLALVTFCFLDFTCYVLWRSLVRPLFSVLRDLPQPPTRGGLITGHSGAVFSIPLGRQVAEWVNTIPNNGMLWFRGMLGSEYLIVASADSLRDVLFSKAYDFEKTSGFRRYTKRFLADGLVAQEGDVHKARRRAIIPVFQPRNVDALKPMLTTKSDRSIQALIKRCHQQRDGTTTLDICDWGTRFALDVACMVGFGEDMAMAETPEVKPILSAYTTVFSGDKSKMGQYAWHQSAPKFLVNAFPHKLDHNMDISANFIRKVGNNAVKKRMDSIARGEKPPQDFLTEVLQSNKFSPKEASDELLILLAAAHESTAALIAMTIYQLTQHPTLQSALRDELTHFGLTPTNSDIPEPKYEQMALLNAILNEMMRLEPPLPITLRKAIRTTTVAGHVVKGGTYIAISPYAMGRSVAIWGHTANVFNPYRWIDPPPSQKTGADAPPPPPPSPSGTLNEHGGAANFFGMLTFLKGPKGCTGERFAKAELRRVIASLVANFEWECAQEHVPEQVGIIVVKPEGGIKVRCRPVAEEEVVDEKVDLL